MAHPLISRGAEFRKRKPEAAKTAFPYLVICHGDVDM